MPTRPPQHRPPWWRPPVQAERDRKREYDKGRPNSARRGYDGAWKRVRAEYLAEHPICEWPGCTAPAIDVDHKLSVRDRPDLRLVKSNFRSGCRHHHSQRTAREQGFARRKDQR